MNAMRRKAAVRDWLARHEWPIALAALTVVVRVLYLASVSRDPFSGYLRHIPDSFYFNNWAQEIISRGDWAGGKDVYFIGPLYAYFLAFIYAVIGPRLTVVRMVQVALEAGTALFLYGLGRRTVGEKPARVGTLLWALYLPAVFQSSFILPVALDLLLVVGGLYLLARGPGRRIWNWLGGGLMLGLAALDRTNMLVFAAAAVPVFLIYRKAAGWRRLVAFGLAFGAVVGLATVRNGLVAGDWVVVSSQGGVNFYLGNSAKAKGVYWNLGEIGQGRPEELNRDLARTLAEAGTGRELKPSQVSAWWFGEGFKWLRAHPGRAARLYWDKFRLLTNDYEVALNVDFYFMKFITPFHLVPLPYFGFVFAFGAVGLFLGWRGSSFGRTLAVVFLASYGASVMAFFISDRYRILLAPPLMLFAGAALVKIYGLWRGWRWKAAAALTAAAVAAGAFAIWPPLEIKRDGAFGQSFYRYGKFYFDEGDYERSISYFHKAMMLSPEIPETYILLGVAYDKMGQRDTALETFRLGVMVAPDRAANNYNYGVALARAGYLAEAEPFVARATVLMPDYLEAWYQLAEVYIGLHDYPRAEAALGRAAALAPADAALKVRLAALDMDMGKDKEGVEWALAALEADPRQPGANFILGLWYYQRGDFAPALGYFQREAANDQATPRTFGFLAATHLRLGERDRARAEYRRYLELGGQRDPKFEKEAGVIVVD